jgi:hypothetical protein
MGVMEQMKKLKKLFYKIHKPRLKAKYQFGSPIVGVYQYQHYLVIATKLDVYITEDGINYTRAKHEREV